MAMGRTGVPDLFSSGMWRAIMTRGSVHSTTQPCRSLRRVVSTPRNSLGIRLQVTGVRIWMAKRGGH